MKILIERAALLRSLAHVQSVVERRNAIPILSNVLIEASGATLRLNTTDMDISIIEATEANVAAPGATTTPVHTLHDIVRKLPEGAQVELALEEDGSRLALRAGRSNFRLGCLPREDFPVIEGDGLPHEFAMSAADLRTVIDRTRFAISTEETRYYLNGIYWHAKEENSVQLLRAVATDGHRLARLEMPLPEGAAGIPGAIVPRKTVNELHRLIAEADATVQIGLSENKIRFSFGSIELTSKLIDGTFPDYERVIPNQNDKAMTVATKPFREAVDRVSTISTEKSRAVKLMLSPGPAGGNLTLQATSPDAGSATEELEIAYGDEDMEIGFNARYLLDIANQIEGEELKFELADSGSPTVIRDLADEASLYVLMPMRV
ncbi:MAG: DNA polymerase III subunit beta [Rhodospirillaceae bacterium]|nr:DNA polymerase III subunit beta [Rhodospirillaceae bacterium]MYB13017.1 DNA polymerase III subunit beta [Rhodospirillaceae bacterium]MYI51130.1 DNA polymerase III subunit beta [Rhodospirillaceae bacterium]